MFWLAVIRRHKENFNLKECNPGHICMVKWEIRWVFCLSLPTINNQNTKRFLWRRKASLEIEGIIVESSSHYTSFKIQTRRLWYKVKKIIVFLFTSAERDREVHLFIKWGFNFYKLQVHSIFRCPTIGRPFPSEDLLIADHVCRSVFLSCCWCLMEVPKFTSVWKGKGWSKCVAFPNLVWAFKVL